METWRGAPRKAQLRAEMALGISLGLPVCPSEPVIYALGQGGQPTLEGHHAMVTDGHGGAARSLEPAANVCHEPSPSPALPQPGLNAFSSLDAGSTSNGRCCVGPRLPEVGTIQSPTPTPNLAGKMGALGQGVPFSCCLLSQQHGCVASAVRCPSSPEQAGTASQKGSGRDAGGLVKCGT